MTRTQLRVQKWRQLVVSIDVPLRVRRKVVLGDTPRQALRGAGRRVRGKTRSIRRSIERRVAVDEDRNRPGTMTCSLCYPQFDNDIWLFPILRAGARSETSKRSAPTLPKRVAERYMRNRPEGSIEAGHLGDEG
jgi:hypothetical protein